MRVILLEDIPKLGKRHNIKEVSDGYARNFLLPRKLAAMTTSSELARVEVIKRRESKKIGEKKEDLANLKKILDNARIVLKVRANEQGRLFGRVGKKEIALEAKKQKGAQIDPTTVQLKEDIKQVGEYPVKLDFGEGLQATLYVLLTEI